MSVLVRDSKGQVRLLTKGAESSILPRCVNDKTDPRFISTVASHIDTFASRGLRTLAVATRTLTDAE
jgi:phospholipid-translocating ATPase